MTHEELLHGRPARISTRSTNGTPRTTCGAVLPGTEPNRHVPANRRFYGARTRDRLRRRTVDAPIRLSFFVFVIRRSNNPAAGRADRGGGRTLDGTRPPRDRLRAAPRRPSRSPLRTLDTGYENRIYAAKPARIRAIAPALAGNGRSSSTRAAAPPAGAPGARAGHGPNRVPLTVNTNYQKLATFLTHLTTSRRYLDTHKLQQSLQQKTQRKGACPRVRGCV
jgi:hypothetical protein